MATREIRPPMLLPDDKWRTTLLCDHAAGQEVAQPLRVDGDVSLVVEGRIQTVLPCARSHHVHGKPCIPQGLAEDCKICCVEPPVARAARSRLSRGPRRRRRKPW